MQTVSNKNKKTIFFNQSEERDGGYNKSFPGTWQ